MSFLGYLLLLIFHRDKIPISSTMLTGQEAGTENFWMKV